MRPRHLLLTLLTAAASAASPACGSSDDAGLAPGLAPGEESVGRVTSAASAVAEVASFGTNPGALKMFEYVPATLKAGAPAVLVFHGCAQTATDAAAAGWNALAEELGFVVVYPEQALGNNSLRCFNWAGEFGNGANLQRGQGENQSIKEMADKVVADHGVDPKKVFLFGFSAGGAEAALAAATWPDVFAGVGIVSGIPFNCTTVYAEVSSCQKPGKDRTAAEWGTLVRDAFPGFTGKYPRATIWQGASDTIVGTANRAELVEQWTDVHGVAAAAPITDTVDGQAHTSWKDASGAVVVESYEIAAMGHGIPIAPAKSCGTAGAYALDAGICAPRLVAKFFGLDGSSAPGADAGADASKPGPPVSSSSSTGGVGSDAGATGGGGGLGAASGPVPDGSAGSTCSVTATAPGRAGLGTSAAPVALGLALSLAAIGARRRPRSSSNPTPTRHTDHSRGLR